MSGESLGSIVVDLDRCWGCKTCEVACSLEHRLDPRLSFVRVEAFHSKGSIPGSAQGKSFVPVLCQHCREPACVASCSSGALAKGADGIVRSDPGACIGCGVCEEACPHGAIAILPDSGNPGICGLCATRQASGRLPACVQHCPGRALTLALPEDRLRTVEDSKIHWAVGLTEYKAKRCRCQESIG